MPASENQIVVYQPNETVRLDVRLENETVWLSQEQMCELFQRDRTVITKHVRNVFSEGECDEANNVQILHINQRGRPLALYSLDVIISVGYRVKSLRGTQFRRWATQVIRNYLLHGQTINQRLTQLEDKMDRHVVNHDARLTALEAKVDFFVQTKEPPLQEIFYQGKFWDAKEEIFWTGASLKDAGRLTFAAAQMGAEVIPGLLESIRKAASEQREYGKGIRNRAKNP